MQLRILLVVCLLPSLLGSARAQDPPRTSRPPVFPTLFRNPTGMNAYEDWVYAGDLVQNNQIADAVLEEGASLTLKRQLFHDPTVQQALLLLHKSLDKPAQPPRTTINEDTQFLEFATFRKLARLLNTQIYVCFADGRIDAAMEVLSDGLRFGYRLQFDTLLSGLVGIAVETIVLLSFALHLDQLSEYHCSHLQRFVEDWFESPSPVLEILSKEKEEALQSLEAKRNNAAGLERMLAESYPADEDLPPDAQALLEHLRSRPGDIGPALDYAKTLIVAHYDNALANLKLPVKERIPLQEVKNTSLGGKLFNRVGPTFHVTVYKYDRMATMIRLLGVHAAIRRYRWEHNHLPNTLADLHIGPLTIDPFTGNGLLYKRNGETYDLSSFGPVERNAQGKVTPVSTQPVRL